MAPPSPPGHGPPLAGDPTAGNTWRWTTSPRPPGTTTTAAPGARRAPTPAVHTSTAPSTRRLGPGSIRQEARGRRRWHSPACERAESRRIAAAHREAAVAHGVAGQLFMAQPQPLHHALRRGRRPDAVVQRRRQLPSAEGQLAGGDRVTGGEHNGVAVGHRPGRCGQSSSLIGAPASGSGRLRTVWALGACGRRPAPPGAARRSARAPPRCAGVSGWRSSTPPPAVGRHGLVAVENAR